MTKKALTYKEAGVDIEAGESFVKRIKPLIRSTQRPEVIGDIGSFGGLFALRSKEYREPLLVASTDSVGTKVKLATLMQKYDTIGIDMVAMCVNDILVQGAEPLFFLDYIATGRLKVGEATEVMKGIVQGCKQAGCALLGGETAEMPGMYKKGEYELVGFVVGIVEKSKVIDGSKIEPGDKIIGLASNGLHSNGFSLVRKILFNQEPGTKNEELSTEVLKQEVKGLSGTLGEELLRPTRIYRKLILELLKSFPLKGLAHITGGGLPGNIPRILPAGCKAVINKQSWEIPAVFSYLQKKGNIPEGEMYRVFNMGLGMVLIVSPKVGTEIVKELSLRGEKCWLVGEIAKGKKEVEFC